MTNTTGNVEFPDAFVVPDGAICGWCDTPLTPENIATKDVTDTAGTPPWEATPPDEPRVLVLSCIECVLTNRINEDPDT